jgi:cbb3-type cytochrome oxidase subunit 3
MFTIAISYAFWPTNQEKFREAANLPLDDQEENHS